MPDDIRWIRSYVLAETDGTVGTVCIYQASSPEAIREHARRADLPADEIIEVADTVIVRPDPEPACRDRTDAQRTPTQRTHQHERLATLRGGCRRTDGDGLRPRGGDLQRPAGDHHRHRRQRPPRGHSRQGRLPHEGGRRRRLRAGRG